MRRARLLLLALVLLAPASHGGETASTDEAWKLGYSIGFQVGGDFRRSGRALDPDLAVEGLLHALDATDPRLTPAEMREALGSLREASGTPPEETQR